jgi:predicted O-methyltransferase YrrM
VTPAWLPAYQRRAAARSDLGHNLHILFGAAARYPACQVLEIGVGTGQSTTAFLAAAELTGGHLWSVDISASCLFLLEYVQSGRPGPWTFILGDAADQAVSGRAPDSVDVLFIDSSHTYAQTRTELETYVPRVRPGGMVLLHDTTWQFADRPGAEVADALNETLPRLGLSWRELGGENGLGLIEIPEGGAACP